MCQTLQLYNLFSNVALMTYSHGQKYRHPCKCNSVRKFTCLLFLFALQQPQKDRRKVKLDKIAHRTQKWTGLLYRTQKWTGQNYWHLVKIVRNNCFSSMWCSCNLYLDTHVESNRCGQYSNHTCNQLKWRKVDSPLCCVSHWAWRKEEV